MGKLLLHNPWFHLYLLYVGGLVIVFLCTLHRPNMSDRGGTGRKELTEVKYLRGKPQNSKPSVNQTGARFPKVYSRVRAIDPSRNGDEPPFFPCI
jgi:hypothetical protein